MTSVPSITLEQLKACLDVPEKIYGNELLSWFADQNDAKVLADEFIFAGKKTYRFCANLTSDEGLSGFGRSQDELTAAIKACAESIERQTYIEFLRHDGFLYLQIKQNRSAMTIESNNQPTSIASSFHNSNGWAVGFSVGSAIERAKIEALERHLLLLTFIKDGWDGFYEINRMTVDGIEFVSLLSRYTLAGYSAGIGVARSEKFKGASFGYICDKTEYINTSPKWEQAFYESFDYIRVRAANETFRPQRNLVSQGLNYYLETDFIEEFSTDPSSTNLGESFNSSLAVIDLAKSLNLDFPFFAAVVHGQDLLPLYFKKSLTPANEEILKTCLAAYKVFEPLPERHPIL